MTAWSAKVWEQHDLRVGEGPHLGAADRDNADRLAPAHEGHRQDRAETAAPRGPAADRILLGLGLHVGDLHHLSQADDVPGQRALAQRQHDVGIDRPLVATSLSTSPSSR
jgi:hypothetical protein